MEVGLRCGMLDENLVVRVELEICELMADLQLIPRCKKKAVNAAGSSRVVFVVIGAAHQAFFYCSVSSVKGMVLSNVAFSFRIPIATNKESKESTITTSSMLQRHW